MSLFNAQHDEHCFEPTHVYDVATSCPVRLLLWSGTTYLRPLPRVAAIEWRRNWSPLPDFAGRVADTERAQLQNAFSCPARAASLAITARAAQQREMRLPGLYWTEADALARVVKWRTWLEAGPRVFQATTDRYLGQIECGDIGKLIYPA